MTEDASEDMPEDPLTGYIRAKVIAVFRHGSRILVGEGHDPARGQPFYCPLGGRIEFGEPSLVALRREIREEIESEIERPRLLGVLENLFTFDGRPGHEVVFVYDAELARKELYDLASFGARESDGQPFLATWLDLGAITPDTPPLYPDGLAELLGRGTAPGGWTRAVVP